MKICPKCKTHKASSEYHKDHKRKDGLCYQCKQCAIKATALWQKNNKMRNNINTANWAKANPEKVRQSNLRWYYNHRDARLKYSREYQELHYDKRLQQNREWRKNNSQRAKERAHKYYEEKKLSKNISRRIYASLKGNKNGQRWENIVGYTLKQLRCRLESLFSNGMTWKNYGKWHIDHIRPVRCFSFTSMDDIEFKKCWALKNLQPLWAEDNLSKGAKII